MSFFDMALRAGLAGPASTFNDFINKAASKVTEPVTAVNDRLRSLANPYAKQSTLERMQALPDAVLSCDWIAVVNGPTQEIPWEYIHTIQAPSLDIQVAEHRVNANMRRTASVVDFGDITIGLYTDRNATSINWAHSWMRRVARRDGYYSLPKDYYRDVTLFLLDSKRNTVVDMTFIDCFPKQIQAYDLGPDSSILYTQMTLAVNDLSYSMENDLTAAAQGIGSLFPRFPRIGGISGY